MKATNEVNGLIFKDEGYDIKKQAAKHSYQGIEAILEALEKAKIRINANVNFDLVIELQLMTIKENYSHDKNSWYQIQYSRQNILL